MPREGRTLELLVARLEAAASAGEAEVRSPEYFIGRNSESHREVDVTVRSKVGSTDVLVMFECRDRASTQDVRWIDELAGKRDDIGANVAVAVTAGDGFTSGARKAAKRHGIDLRTVESITLEDVISWCQMGHLTVQMFEVRDQDLEIETWEDCPPLANRKVHPLLGTTEIDLHDPLFTLWDARNKPEPRGPEWLTGKQFHDSAMELYLDLEGLPKFYEWTRISMIMSSQETPTVAVKTTEGRPFPLAGLRALAEVRIKETQVPVSLKAITDSNGATTQVVEAVARYDDQECTVSFIRSADGIAVTMVNSATPDA
jgi:hypothetical protein